MSSGDSRYLARVAGGIAVGALAAQVWDHILNMGDEVKYLWRGKLNLVKVLYFSVRYFILGVQIITQVMSFELEAAHHGFWGQCKTLRIIRITSGMLSAMVLQMILLIRVRALYYESRLARYFLSILYHVVVASQLAGITILIQDLKSSSNCDLHPRAQFFGLILFGIGGGVFQIMNVGMTVTKLAFRKPRTPLMAILLREAVYTFMALSSLISAQLVNQAFNKDKHLQRAFFAYVVFKGLKWLAMLTTTPTISSSWYLASISIGVRHRHRHYLINTQIHFSFPHRGRNFS
ncbi:hypothetical protein HYPSUDRAFT_338095 [Hypholoma sublateritium FD-334 SS-4]|uniref:DUF6533 domain-containing protein n=1 Tax=Hypholoma sublateritium (strain FD-334 SS-4) TaxID=945553 RepID=A0A0D2P5R8_HYPSF|nr:hypothetical protein HYPSUDRAFT_338095 [Hypholoma sublateritium FD-334 SS-4]